MGNLNRIKLVLVEKNKTENRLVEELDKTPCTVRKWCQNSAQLDLKTFNLIVDSLKVEVNDVIVSNFIPNY